MPPYKSNLMLERQKGPFGLSLVMPLIHQPSIHILLEPEMNNLGNDNGLDELQNMRLQKLQKLVKTVLRKLLVMKWKVKLKKPIYLQRIPQMKTKFFKMSFALTKVLRR